MSIRVLLADAHETVRRAIQMLLGVDPEMKVVTKNEDFGEALCAATELKLAVVVMDLDFGTAI